MHRLRLASLLLALLALGEKRAAGEPRAGGEGPPIHLEVEPCGGAVSSPEVARIAALELRAESVETVNRPTSTTRVRVQCVGHRAIISVFDPLTEKSLARAIELDTVAAPSRSRLLALAVAELVAASWIELDTNLAPVAMGPPPASEPLSADAARASAVDAARRVARGPREGMAPSWRALGFVSGLWFPLDPSPLAGVGIGVGVDPYASIGIDVDAMVLHGSSAFALGTVSSDLVCAGAAIRLTHSLGRVVVHGGPGIRAGYARLGGTPLSAALASGHTVSGGWAAPTVAIGASYAPGRHFLLDGTVEAGDVVVPVRGSIDGVGEIGVHGALLGMRVGAGWLF
jgi:hypothetical protein